MHCVLYVGQDPDCVSQAHEHVWRIEQEIPEAEVHAIPQLQEENAYIQASAATLVVINTMGLPKYIEDAREAMQVCISHDIPVIEIRTRMSPYRCNDIGEPSWYRCTNIVYTLRKALQDFVLNFE